MSSSVPPLAAVRSGPLQTGHTNSSSSRLSIDDSSRTCFALCQALHHDAEQCSRFDAVELRVYGHIPMPPIGQAGAFYGIFLGHEHRPFVGEHDVLGSDTGMIGQGAAEDLDSVRAQHVEKPFRI